MAKFQEIESAVVSLDKQVKLLTKDLQALITTVNSNSKSQTDLTNKTKAVTKATNSLTELEKQRISLAKQTKKVFAQNLAFEEKKERALIKGNLLLRKRRAALKEEITGEKAAAAAKKASAAAQRKLNKDHTAAIRINNNLNKSTKKSGGLFRSMAKSALVAGAAMLGFRAVINVFKKVITKVKNFEKAMSKVKAITNETDEEFKELRKDALRLGSTTSKTATQVAELQTEFAKLGFSTAEILAATEATIQLSIAAGTDLADAAQVAGATVRGFGLSANETQRVVDVMAESFASSALDLEKFKIAMSKVAPVAKASGKTIEFATSQLGILSDAGLEASIAGTSLRNMFLELNKQGLTWEQGLEKINTSTNKNVTALNLFGKRGATAALILADNVDKAEELETALDGAAGSAKAMADIMEDNLSGELTRTQSKWEGFIQSLENGEGGIATATRGLVKLWGTIAEGFEILSTGQDAFLAKQLQEIYSEDINKRVAEDLKIRKEQVGVEQALTEFKEDEANNILYINELEQQLLETSDRRRDKEKKRVLEQELIETKVLADVLAKTIQSEEDGIQAGIDAETEAARIKLELKKKELEEEAALKLKWARADEKERIKNYRAAKKEQEAIDSAADQESIERQKAQLEKEFELLQQAAEDEIALAKKVADEEEALRVKKLDDIATGLDFIGQASQEIFDLQRSLADSEISNIERQRDAEIAAAEKAGKDTSNIEAKYAKKEAKLRTEQAKKEKQQALFTAAIKTAQAIVVAAAAAPAPANIPLIAFAAALGAVQIAAIAAQPIPKFKHGTDGQLQLDTTAIVGDGGKPELVTTPQGSFISPATDTKVHLPAGSQVFPNYSPETQAALSGGMTEEMYNGLVNEQRLTRKAIQNQPKEIHQITGAGYKFIIEKNNHRTIRRDKYFG